MPAPDVSKVSPADVAATVRSLPGRFRALFVPLDDDVEAMAGRAPEGKLPASAHVRLATASLDQVREALDKALVHDDPDVTIPSGRPVQPTMWNPVDVALGALLDDLDRAATALADAVGRVDADEWMRPAHLDGQPISALGLARQAMRLGVGRLRDAEAAMSAVRDQPDPDDD